jgi:hypothetical protein
MLAHEPLSKNGSWAALALLVVSPGGRLQRLSLVVLRSGNLIGS